ncbi:MAG: hypothetical protein ABFS12_10235 [Bacteroidota bacterium]
MKTTIITIAVLLLGYLTSCTNNKTVALQYAIQDVESVKYDLTYSQNSVAKMSEEPMSAQYSVSIPLELSSHQNNSVVKSEITIPKTTVKLTFPSGQQTLDTRNLKNIRLDLSYTSDGNNKEIVSLNDSMVIDFGEMLGGTLDWEYLFKYVTPNLPGTQVKKGDVWNESLLLQKIEGGSKIDATIVFSHKISGFDEIDGRRCAVIESKINSNIDDAFELMALPWTIGAVLSGDMIWHFDYQQGLIVNLKIEEKSSGEIIEAGGEMSATYDQTTIIELNLINK